MLLQTKPRWSTQQQKGPNVHNRGFLFGKPINDIVMLV